MVKPLVLKENALIADKWRAVIVLCLSLVALLGLYHIYGSSTVGSISNIVIASVYVASLYIGWKKLLTGQKENIEVSLENSETTRNPLMNQEIADYFIRFMNTGNSAVNLHRLYCSIAVEEEDKFVLHSPVLDISTTLDGGESETLPLNNEFDIFVPYKVEYHNWLGEPDTEKIIDEGLYNLSPEGEEFSQKLTRLLRFCRGVPPTMTPNGLQIPKEKLRENNAEEIAEEYMDAMFPTPEKEENKSGEEGL
jgi:hypothetical protein